MEPIAVIGIACRFPGGAKDPASFWEVLRNGKDTITKSPTARWNTEKNHSVNTSWGGFLHRLDGFDTSFFQISSREAKSIDPQQRLIMEVAWEALENAAIDPMQLANSATGVFIGVGSTDYHRLVYQNQNSLDAYSTTGTGFCIVANRLSYFLNLRGPSISLDTACSSSLVAVHLACQSLRQFESQLCLVGGVNTILSPESTIIFSQAGMMAADGRCKTFDASADGYVRGEGCGVVVLKRFSDAIKDGDNIQAVIKGTAVNQDGLTNGLSAPNGLSQQAVIRQALEKAEVKSAQISYVETHGTGTSLGDPIEVNSLKTVFNEDRELNQPCYIGSVKTNIGHLEAAAGIAGLIKVVLSLQNQEIPPNLHFKQLNPYIKIKNTPIKIPTSLQEWSTDSESRLAGVSSFGFGGTNAHVIVEEAPRKVKGQRLKVKGEEFNQRPHHILTLSAKSEPALKELVQRYEEFLKNDSKASIDDICFTANTGRSHFSHRLAIIASDKLQLTNELALIGSEEEVNGVFKGQLSINNKLQKIAFLFTGQGSQYINMGRVLYESQPVFRETVLKCNEILKLYIEKSIVEVIYPENNQDNSNSIIDQTAYTQPALFAIEYALYKLWESWGIKPSVVMGHSVGEYVAATVAGVFSLEDGLKLIANRGRLMQQLPTGGEMLSIMASHEQVKQFIAPYSQKVSVAAINGPQSVVISGESEAIGQIKVLLESVEIKTKQLQVSHAFHSHLMKPMLAEFKQIASEITYNQPQIPLISNVTGSKANDNICTADYWINHVRQPVKFARSMETLEQLDYQIFLEIGPKPILLGMGRECLSPNVGVWLPSLRPNHLNWQQMLSSLGELYIRGVKVDWVGFDKDYSRSKVILPTYPFQRQRYWIENKLYSYEKQYLTNGKNIHPLLGKKLNCAGEQQIFASLLGEDSPAYLSNHRVFNQVLFPTTAYLEIALAAAFQQWGTTSVVVEDLKILKGLILTPRELVNLQTVLSPSDNKSYQLQIFSQPQHLDEPEWLLHGTALIRPQQTSQNKTKINLEQYRTQCNKIIDVKQHYKKFSQIGIDYGSSFQGIEKLWVGENQALAQINLPEELIGQTIDYQFHPVLLDAALQVIFYALPQTDSDKTYLPVGVEEFKIYSNPELELWAYVSGVESTTENKLSLKVKVTLTNPEGEIIATIEGLEVKPANKTTLLGTEAQSVTDWFYEVDWRSKCVLGKLGSTDFLLKPLEIEQKLTPGIRELVTQIDESSSSFMAASLEELSLDYIVQGLLSMGWSYKLEESFNPDTAAQRLGVVPTQQRLFKRLLQILSEVGILSSNQQQWQVRQTLEKVNPTSKNQSLLNQFPDEAATLTLLDRCASQLCEILKGAVDPVQLVFPQGDLTTATQLYEDSSTAQVMNAIVQKTITQASEKLPPIRGIRLLEIGAGTGGTTSYVLPHLNPNQAQYTFTDIGALFIRKAQEKFRDYKFLDYQTLDIEQDPSTQGFASHQYDIVIAANVLHATTDIKQTLSHVRQLLAPGGMLVLYETTTRTRWLDLIFGLLEGWWRFQDYKLRPDYPLLNRAKWKEALVDTGFSTVVTLPEIEGIPQILSQQAVIVAKAPQAIESTESSVKSWLLFADEKGIAQKLAKQLNSKGDVCTLVKIRKEYKQISPTEFTINPKNPSEYEQLVEKLATSSPPLYGVVQCWSTNSGVDKAINSEQLEQLSFLGCGTSLFLVQALVKAGLAPRLWLVTCGSQGVPNNQPVIPGIAQSSLWGMGKVIGLEHPELNCVRIDLDPIQTVEIQAKTLFNEVWSEDKEDQVAYRGDSRYVARLVPSSYQQNKQQQLIQSKPFKLGISQRGSLDSLILEPVNRVSPKAGEIEIRVKATGLNFRDVLIALDIYPGEPIIGVDCAGEIVSVGVGVTGLNVGDLVIAMAAGSFSKYVTVDARYAIIKPENLSFEQAASIPVNFLTAYYTLHHVAKIATGDKVLIHAATGGTGMAAVQIAQAAGAEVFATASPSKWEALRKMGVKHIMNSRTLEFADQTISLTQGKGVDIVLNSLTSGEFISKSLSVVSFQGKFVEIGKRGVWDSSQVTEIRSDLSYFVVDLVRKSQEQPELIKEILHQLIDKFSNGLLQPPPLKIFPIQEASSAFRYMQQAKHIGKIVVNQKTLQDNVNNQKYLNLRCDATYLITGGMGGLGLLVADWMISNGAKNLVLVGRSSPNQAAREKLAELQKTGATVVVEKADVSDVTDMTRVLHNIENFNMPLAGIIHSAGMLSDGVLINQIWSNFEKVMAAKVQGSWLLHNLTQNQSLDFFILFSSVASLLGSPGQGNHSAANGFLDGLAHYRQSMGLPGLSINWGAVSQVGEAVEKGADIRATEQGMGTISPHQVLESLELLMGGSNTKNTEVGVMPINWLVWHEKVSNWPFLSDWQEIIQLPETQRAGKKQNEEFYKLLKQLKAAFPEEREKLLKAYLQDEVAQVLGMSAGRIDLQQPLNTMGLDSLMAVELRNRLHLDLAVDIPIVKFMEDINISDLVTQVNEQFIQVAQNEGVESKNNGQLYQINGKENERIRGEL
ncbi:MAG: SDR family NAD(P)-dependent oxidoreductase [Cyanobacteria bacterium P01_A01_bin.84]